MPLLPRLLSALLLLGLAGSANAYIGPGAGISLVGSLFTALAAVLLAFFAILFWPVRYLFRRLRAKKTVVQTESESD